MKTRFIPVIVVCCLFATTGLAAETQHLGQLCFGIECRSYSCGEPVAATEAARTFSYSLSRSEHYLGILGPGITIPSCDPDGVVDVRVRLLDVAAQAVVLRLRSSSGNAWELRFTQDELEKPITIHIPRGEYGIDVQTPHFVAYHAPVHVAADRVALIAELRPLRTIAGLIVDRVTGTALSGANIRADTGSATTAGREGRFALEIDAEKWPKQLTVSLDGYGRRVVAVPRARLDTSLDDILLDRGVTVEATIHQTEPGQVVSVELLRLRNRGRLPGSVIQTLTLPKSTSMSRTVRFENVEPGQYVVLANGAKASQRAGQRIDLQEWDVPPVNVQLTPFHLRLLTVSDGRPLGEARVILRQHEMFWEIPVEIDATGEATVALWQAGKLSATVESRGSVPYRNRRTIAEPVDADWPLEMPRLEVIGKVIDAESGSPIANAGVALEMKSAEQHEHLSVSATAGQDGAFRFAPVFPGEHTIKAAAEGYPVSEVTYSFGEEEESHSLTVALQRTPMTRLSVVDARGAAVAGADFFVLRGDMSVVASGRTDTTGKTPVFIPDGEARNVYVVPRDGSLGVTRIQSGTPAVAMMIGDGVSRIGVRAESESHDPIPRISLDVRYNGFLLPIEVMQILRARGSRTSSDADGRMVLNHMPAGVYELWPAPAHPGSAPVRMIAAPGDNVAVLTFARVESR